MNDCANAEMRDLLPGLMHGMLSTEQRQMVEAHLSDCSECRAELVLLQQVRAASMVAPPIDTRMIVNALPRPPVGRPGAGFRGWGIRAAAATVLVAAAGIVAVVGSRGGPTIAESIRGSGYPSAGALVPGEALADLSEGELRSLLAALEDFDGLPAAEPRSVVSSLPVLGEDL